MRNLTVDGAVNPDDPDGPLFEGDGKHPPFAVFDVDQQIHLPGRYGSRQEAEAALTVIPGTRQPAVSIVCRTSYFFSVSFEVPEGTENWKARHTILEEAEQLAGEMDLDDYKMIGWSKNSALITADHSELAVLEVYKDKVLEIITEGIKSMEKPDEKA